MQSMTTRRMLAVTIATGLAMGLAGGAQAHHSATAYDGSKSLTINGTVKDWQWTNPHCWLQLMVDDGGGAQVEAGYELGSPNTLIRNGFGARVFKPGDKVTVVYGPRRDGKPGGGLTAVLTAEGKWLQWGPQADAKAAQEAARARQVAAGAQ